MVKNSASGGGSKSRQTQQEVRGGPSAQQDHHHGGDHHTGNMKNSGDRTNNNEHHASSNTDRPPSTTFGSFCNSIGSHLPLPGSSGPSISALFPTRFRRSRGRFGSSASLWVSHYTPVTWISRTAVASWSGWTATNTVTSGLICGYVAASCCGFLGVSPLLVAEDAFYIVAATFLVYFAVLATGSAGFKSWVGVDVTLLLVTALVYLGKREDEILNPAYNWEVSWVRPVAFTVFGIPVQSFGLWMAVAFLVCYELADREFVDRKIRCEVAPLLVLAVVGGLLGAKLHYIWLRLEENGEDVFFAPGLVWQGGAIAGTLSVIIAVKVMSTESVARILDVSAPFLPLGHALGKLGCFSSGDGCYGPYSSYYFAMSFPNGYLPTKKPVHPTPLYEFLLSGGVFYFLWRRRQLALHSRGDQTTLMFVLTSVTRFVTERWRDHDHDGRPEPFWPFNAQQKLCVVTFLSACVLRLGARYMNVFHPGVVGQIVGQITARASASFSFCAGVLLRGLVGAGAGEGTEQRQRQGGIKDGHGGGKVEGGGGKEGGRGGKKHR